MKITGNTIKIKVEHLEKVLEPIMVKGKPTKRMKEVWKEVYVEKIAEGIEFDGHEIFIYNKSKNEKPEYRCYKADGTMLLASCLFGVLGQAEHLEIVYYNPQNNSLYVQTNGYCGTSGRGFGARIKNIEW